MKRVLTFGLTLLVAGIAVSLLAAAPTQRKFSPRQEPTGIGNLIVPGDRVALVYEAGVKGVTGSVYVRNDRRRKFVRLGLVLDRPRSSSYRARVPRRLIRGQHLRYYAVLRQGSTGRGICHLAEDLVDQLLLQNDRVAEPDDDPALVAAGHLGGGR